MKKANLLMIGRSQIIELPKEFRFKIKEVTIQKHGEGILILPVNTTVTSFQNCLEKFSDDFMSDRKQPKKQKRDSF